MINKKQIERDQVMHVIANGEFEGSVISSKSKVVVVMTQDWCPQWQDMKSWIFRLQTDEDIDIYQLEYNKEDYFDKFMTFKENEWNNHNIPYLRFYKEGALFRESNYISEDVFAEILGIG